MDPTVVAFGTGLIGAIATETWQLVRDAVTGLWRKVHPHQADSVSAELDALREEILQARQDGDADIEHAYEQVWQLKLRYLLRANPALAGEMQRVLDQVLIPALSPTQQTRVQSITGTASGNARLNQAGRDVNVVGGDSYTAGRDQHIHKP